MTARRRIPDVEGRSALASWQAADGHIDRDVIATAVRWSLEELNARAPGQSVEVRVPPIGAVQILEGTTHRRGTPPAVVEMGADTFLRLVVGDMPWPDAVAKGLVVASGERADLSGLLPLANP
ncbi:sterol carrier family protein [Demequina sp.]|uniref:sterol carrier family protein n=1 Tax=Demequina sp. TaxID=2050685 RepID=UPI003D0C9EC2